MKNKNIIKDQSSKRKPHERRPHDFEISVIRGKEYHVRHGKEFVRIEEKEGDNPKEWVFDKTSNNWNEVAGLPRVLKLEVESIYL